MDALATLPTIEAAPEVVEFRAPSPELWPAYLVPVVSEIRRRFAILGKPPETVTKEIRWNMTGQSRGGRPKGSKNKTKQTSHEN